MSIPTKVQVNISNIHVFEQACLESGYQTEMKSEDELVVSKNGMYRKANIIWDETQSSYVIETDSDDEETLKEEVFPMYSALQIQYDLQNNPKFNFDDCTMQRNTNNEIIMEFNAVV